MYTFKGIKAKIHIINPMSENVPDLNRINFREFLIVLDRDVSRIFSVDVCVSFLKTGVSSTEAAFIPDPEVVAAKFSIAAPFVSDVGAEA